jgi:hypothetical protein
MNKQIQQAEVRIPIIQVGHHNRIKKGLKKLIEDKLIPIIQQAKSLDESAEEQNFFNISFSQVIYILQRHIVKRLKIEENQPQRRNRKMNYKRAIRRKSIMQ